jgi:hypothetical protein
MNVCWALVDDFSFMENIGLRAKEIYKPKYTIQVQQRKRSNTEAVECAAGALEGIDNVESGDSLSLCVLSIRHRVTDDLRNMLESKLNC